MWSWKNTIMNIVISDNEIDWEISVQSSGRKLFSKSFQCGSLNNSLYRGKASGQAPFERNSDRINVGCLPNTLMVLSKIQTMVNIYSYIGFVSIYTTISFRVFELQATQPPVN